MHCDYNHPNISTHAHNLHKIMYYLHTLPLCTCFSNNSSSSGRH